jgi:pimeloyl-ACP methyl ester carboxylesterase
LTLETQSAAGIAYLRRPGTSRPLVLLHGIGSDAESWAAMIDALDPAIDAIAWNAPGYGDSTALTESAPAPSHYAVRLARFLDAIGVDRVTLVGHSLGALFAGRFAVAYPERVAALALMSPALGYGIGADEALPAGVQGRIDDLARLGPAALATARAARLVHRPDAKPAILAGVRRAMGNVRMPGYAQAVRALGAGMLLADVAHIAAATLVAVGEEDVVTPPANAHAVHAALPRTQDLVLVPDAGHALPQEAPAVIAQLLGTLTREAGNV